MLHIGLFSFDFLQYIKIYRKLRGLPDICKYLEGMLQRLHGVPGLPLDERREQNNIPVLNRKNNSDEDLAFFPQFVELAVFFQDKMLIVGFFQITQRDLRELEYLPEQFPPQLLIQGDEKGGQRSWLSRWYIGFDCSYHNITLLSVVSL